MTNPDSTVRQTRVEHCISGQQGTLIYKGPWYAAVTFDGDSHPSTVAADSIVKTSDCASGAR